MNKSLTGCLSCLPAILVLLTLSCSMDLEPAKSGTTSVSFTIGTLLPPAKALTLPRSPSARAVAPGLGYLYIRTIGGPKGSQGPFYGPFPLESGHAFTTTNIPAGTYQGIGVLYATEPLDDLTAEWEGQTRTFAQLMRLPDDQFELFTDGAEDSEEPSTFDILLDGLASGEMLDSVTIVKNKANPLSLTLVPMCGVSSIDMAGETVSNVYTETGDADRLIRKFIEIDGIDLPTTYTGNLTCTISATGSPYIGSTALFNEDGVLAGTATSINAALTADRNISVPWTGGDTYYLYIEYRAASLSLAFSSDEEPVVEDPVIDDPVIVDPVVVEERYITLNIANGTPNAKVITGIFPYLGEGTEEPPVVAIAIMTLDGSGSGSARFANMATGEPYEFAAGQWFIEGFIDVSNNFPDILENQPIASLLEIEPHQGDRTFEGLYEKAAGAELILPTINEFNTRNTYIYYISQSGNGNRTGNRVYNAMPPEDFALLLAEPEGTRNINAYLVDSVTLNTAQSEWDVPNGYQLTLTSFDPETSLKTVTSAFDHSLRIYPGGHLFLNNITIDNEGSDYETPLVLVDGAFTMEENSTLQNRINGFEGPGGVQVSAGAFFTMRDGSLITRCEGVNGGGVMVVPGGTFEMVDGSSITWCTGSNGGAVQIDSDSDTQATLYMYGGTISNCTASNNGGAIYLSDYVNATLSSGTIYDCNAGNQGGGVYIDNMYDFVQASLTISGVTIQECDAAQGAGVYAVGQTDVIMTDGISTPGGLFNCDATSTGGGFHIGDGGGLTTTLTITGGTISECNASNSGGGVYAYGLNAFVTMSDGTVANCTAGQGGDFFLTGAGSLTFESNTDYLITGTAGGTTGWSIYIESGNLSPTNNAANYTPILQNYDINAIYSPT